MLTRRTFLAGTASLTTLPPGTAPAQDGAAAGRARFEATTLRLAPTEPRTAALHLAGSATDGVLRTDAGRAAPVPLRNDTPDPLALEWRGWLGHGALDEAPLSLAPGRTLDLPVPQGGGTALLRAAPARSHPAGRGAIAFVAPGAPDPTVDRDVVAMLADWLLSADNSLRFGSTPPGDAVASVVTVNGLAQPLSLKLPPRGRLRLRLVNASVQRLMIVACTGARLTIIAIDGQPCTPFAPNRNAVPIGPGARYDLLLDMPEAGAAPVRFTLKPTLTLGSRVEPERDLILFATEGAALPVRPPMAPLPANTDLPQRIPLETARRVDLILDGQPGTPTSPPSNWTVNGISGPAPDKPVLTVRRGEAVVLGFRNATAALVPLRIGGQAVRLLHARDDGWEPYWRDTLLLPPKGQAHVAFVADHVGRWPIDSGFDDLTLAGLSCCFSVTPR